MAWRSGSSSNAGLIANLASHKLITSERVKEAMLRVDRAQYSRLDPYEDSPQQIGHAATISAPHMHAHASESLLPFLPTTSTSSNPTRILDIGSGSGYLTHVLAELAGTNSRVVGLEHISALVELATANMKKSAEGRSLLDSGRVRFVCGDGRKGWPDEAPYDAIHVGAAAAEAHGPLLDQLKAPGRLFIPVQGSLGGQYVWVYDKDENGNVSKEKLFPVSYVPLTDAPK